MKTDLLIVGTGLFAQVATLYFEKYTKYKVVGYTCHSEFIVEKEINNIPVFALENVTKNLSHSNTHVFVATGYKKMNKIRQKLYEEMKEKKYTFCEFYSSQHRYLGQHQNW